MAESSHHKPLARSPPVPTIAIRRITSTYRGTPPRPLHAHSLQHRFRHSPIHRFGCCLPTAMSSSNSEWNALIHQRVRALSSSLAVGGGSSEKDIEQRMVSALPHLLRTSPPSSQHPSLTALLSASPQNVCASIDHTLLRADASIADIHTLCREAHEHHFYSVCVNPFHVSTAARFLDELASPSMSMVQVAAVCGFPLGANTTSIKCAEARQLKELGAREVDVVVNIASLRAGDAVYVLSELTEVVRACSPLPVKVILETALLSDEQIVDGCLLSALAGAAFVKTSTGFNAAGGATVRAVRLMRSVVGERLGVKASGGIRDYATAHAMIAEAGADRLGTSASVSIAAGEKARDKPQQQTKGASGAY